MTKIKDWAINRFVKFIQARERYRRWRQDGAGLAKQDRDYIIETYRFCNVRRNDDRVSLWIHKEWLARWRTHDELWFAMVVARLFNLPDSLAEIADCVLPFNPMKMKRRLHARRDAGMKNFNAAYIVSTNGRAMDKVEYVVDHMLTPMWTARKKMSLLVGQVDYLDDVHEALMQFQGMASFMAAQVVADIKYANPRQWKDFHTFAASGPGSRRGLNRVLGREIGTPMSENDFRAALLDLRDMTNMRLIDQNPITAQDIQNCLCEYDKYERARLDEGKPKQLYTRNPEPLPEGE